MEFVVKTCVCSEVKNAENRKVLFLFFRIKDVTGENSLNFNRQCLHITEISKKIVLHA